eukprot:TRINITY_DN8170_c0_g1_i1.p1 TRINITY_DN8170_c0_g1~~TRINITY_DN8170_c0_g1_i1.p1  ORF type:complete len:125 (+),score=10.94 TRINITY_DN8170_c0_g1_i1:33-407(+)
MRVLSFFVFFIFVGFLPSSDGLTCYSCDKNNVVNGSCTLGEGRTEWCKKKSWCVKTWRNDMGVSWSCEDKGPEDGYEGCTTETREKDTKDTVCYCSSDLCNSGWVAALDIVCLILSMLCIILLI